MLLEKPDPQRAVITASMTAPCDLLAILATADSRGRILVGRDDSAERIELFREMCGENGCFDQPYRFASDHSRVRYFKAPNSSPTLQLYDASTFEVTILSGLPASGKDHWLSKRFDGPVVSLDDLREEMDVDPADQQGEVIAAAKEQAKLHLRAKRPFAWNATNTSRQLREGLINLMMAYGARVRLVYCEALLAETYRRNSQRRVPVPVRVIEKLIDHLDVPDLTEAEQVVYVPR
jgi:predicted kinase